MIAVQPGMFLLNLSLWFPLQTYRCALKILSSAVTKRQDRAIVEVESPFICCCESSEGTE